MLQFFLLHFRKHKFQSINKVPIIQANIHNSPSNSQLRAAAVTNELPMENVYILPFPFPLDCILIWAYTYVIYRMMIDWLEVKS